MPDAVWTRDGRRFSINTLDPHVMTRIFQVKVLRMRVQERCLSPEFADRLLTWRHSGFQVYRAESVEPDDTPALERLCASIGRPVFASTRVQYDPSAGAVRYRTAQGAQLRLDPWEWIALLIQPIPNPGDHTHHDFGYYSNAARGKRQKLATAPGSSAHGAKQQLATAEADSDPEHFRRPCRSAWARLIHRVYEVDPLVCPDDGGRFRVIAFIDAPDTIRRILQHLHLWDLPARPPPVPWLPRKIEALLPDRPEDPDREPSWLDNDSRGSDPVWAD